MSKAPLLSVITVVFNDKRNIRRTIHSVLAQSSVDIEYIVIDGASTDGTSDIIKEFRQHIHHLISEPDAGIYDAMNKGLAIATGTYVLFMNSGDEFYDSNTVKEVLLTKPGADIYYGETEMIDTELRILGRRRHRAPGKLSVASFKFGMPVSHQAIYIKREITRPFDLHFQLSADIDWILQALTRAGTVVNVQKYVARYLVGGQSKHRHWQSLKERYQIFNRYFGYLPNFFNHILIAFRLAGYWLRHGKTND